MDLRWKRSLLRLELLETNDVRLSFGEPSQKVLQSLVDVVNVERGNFHASARGGLAISLAIVSLTS
jgi:hypothetical protein